MRKCIFIFYLFALVAIAFSGCSGGSGEITLPDNPADVSPPPTPRAGTTGIWGVWEVVIDKASRTFDLNQLRQADLALNVLGFLEPPLLVNMGIDFGTLVYDPDNNFIGVDVILKHPFITEESLFNGFDVKGIVFGPAVENADGLTRYFNPDDFTGTPFGYQDGLLGVPDSDANYPGEYNGYKYYADGISLEETVAGYYSDPGNLANRGMFSEGSELKRHYDLRFGAPNTDFMVFNYAIFASYNWPEGEPPFDLEDFIITTANQAEPVFMEVTEVANTLNYNPDTGTGSGSIELEITIFDWVKPVNLETMSIEVPGVIAFTAATFDSDVDANRRLYTVQADGEPTEVGDLDIIVSVTTEKTYGENYFMDLMPPSHPLYDVLIETKFIHTTEVAEWTFPTLPYVDPMDTTTEDNWIIEHGPTHSASIDWTQVGTEWQSNGGSGLGGYYGNFMATYLVSELITVPASGRFNMLLTHRFYVENNYDHCSIYVRYEGESWQPFSATTVNMTGTSPNWPNWSDEYFLGNLTPEEAVQVGFHFFTDDSVYTYPGWFLDHLILTENRAPNVGAVTGESDINSFGVETYSVSASDPDGDNITYAWEIGDDVPPAYDDGEGDGNGNIDIDWQTSGIYIVDCKATDDGDPSLFATSSQPLQVNVDPTGQDCVGKSGTPAYENIHSADCSSSIWEDMCMMSNDNIIVQDQNNSGLWRVPSYGSGAWSGSAITGHSGLTLITQLDSDSNDNIAIAYQSSSTIDVYIYISNDAVNWETTITTFGDVLAMCFDSSDNLWVLVDNANREMHKYNAGTFSHDTGATFNTSSYVYGWVWDFVIDFYEDYFYILHEDDGSGIIDQGVVTKFNTSGVYQDQVVDVFPYTIYDYQPLGEIDPGEADIIIDNADTGYSSCRLIVAADYNDPGEVRASQVVRLKALDLTEIDTPWAGYSWGITCAVMSTHMDPNDPDFEGVFFAGESDDDDWIDNYELPVDGWW